ncbi:MAG: hypothetical protein ACI9N1_000149 [Flavobacteriales bacterium]|jgi:hypothetical protein
MIKVRYILSLLILIISVSNWAQLSESARVYLVTCDEGDEVYEQFGHTALRIEDPISGDNMIFNWGIFNYSEDFEMNFAKGKLDYMVALQHPNDFEREYFRNKRGVRELELNMTLEQKNVLWSALMENIKEENRGYRYDFFYKNCATIIRDHIAVAMGKDLKYGQHPDAGKRSFRQIIDEGFQDLAWTSFGIDLVLGSPIDIIVDNNNMMFHPLQMETIFKSATINDNGEIVPFVVSERVIIEGTTRSNEFEGWFSPTIFAIIILVITMLIGFFQLDAGLRIWGGVLFFILGILGILLVVMWTSTDHQAAKYNWNLLWAQPFLLILVVSVCWDKLHLKFEKVYLVMAMLMFALILFFMMLPQEFHTAARILIMALAFEYYFLHKQVTRMLKVKQG